MPEEFTGKVDFKNDAGNVIFTIDPNAGFVQIIHKTGTGQQVMQLTNTGSFSLVGTGDAHGARLDGTLGWLLLGGNNRVGKAILRNAATQDVIVLDAANAAIYVGRQGNEGDIIVRDSEGRDVFKVDGKSALLTIGANGNEGDLRVLDGQGRIVFDFNAEFALLTLGANGNEGDLILRNGAGADTIKLDGGSGDIVLANADCAEDFDIEASAEVEPGTVIVLGEEGELRQCYEAYDTKVAGVISGAGECRPGLILDKKSSARRRLPVALMGKTYCKVDAAYSPIGVGDLLTTSPTPGHAMRATDSLRAFGASIGKALRPCKAGRGLIPILIALQ